ncbi:Magnesium-dependent phosphatase 1 [Schistosoma japonicum]|nr:Magnesium-dependent phosphatase 1 [Schistosoma japonicum]KAH8857491.1 Magnesium-dependent phosphatase 1 [Schistosoma japonicum]KAH8857492.1 Magnesium-dependent phosphatase 1 [Schistosoma japonicum]
MVPGEFLRRFPSLPKLIVFDLDFTLWPLWCDTHVFPPFVHKNGTVYDTYEKRVDVYPDAQLILRMIRESPEIKLACASRTSAIDVAQQLLQALNWSHLFDYIEIYPGSKVAHFKKFHELSGIMYKDMVFFDDETRNIHEISQLGVHCHLVNDGITLSLLENALNKFQHSRK